MYHLDALFHSFLPKKKVLLDAAYGTTKTETEKRPTQNEAIKNTLFGRNHQLQHRKPVLGGGTRSLARDQFLDRCTSPSSTALGIAYVLATPLRLQTPKGKRNASTLVCASQMWITNARSVPAFRVLPSFVEVPLHCNSDGKPSSFVEVPLHCNSDGKPSSTKKKKRVGWFVRASCLTMV